MYRIKIRKYINKIHMYSILQMCSILLFNSKIEKVLTGHPASYGGLEELDFLVNIQGQEVFEMNHAHVVTLIKNAGDCLNLQIERYKCF